MVTKRSGGVGEPPDLFGSSGAPPAVSRLLQQAAQFYAQTPRAEAILWTAQALDPKCLAVYFALYKFYFYKGMLADAERVTSLALVESARQCGFDPDWHTVTPASADWSDTFGPQHFYLFSLKALAFICLRQGRQDDSAAILAKLQELDPQDSVGASVIRDIAKGAGPAPRRARPDTVRATPDVSPIDASPEA